MDWLIKGRIKLCVFMGEKKWGGGGNFYIRVGDDYFFDTVDKIYIYYLVINVMFSEKSRSIIYQV